MKKLLFIASLLFCSGAYAGTKLLAPTNAPNGNSLPATCTKGDIYLYTGATSGQQWYACESANTWIQQGGSGGSGGASALEVFSNFDGTRSSPTASISIGDALKLSVTGSTAVVTVDFSSVTSRSDAILNQSTLQSGATAYPELLATSNISIGTTTTSGDIHIYKFPSLMGGIVFDLSGTPTTETIPFADFQIVGARNSLFGYRYSTINSGPPNFYQNVGGFVWQDNAGNDMFKMENSNPRFHIGISPYATGNLNVGGNGVIGAPIMYSTYTAPTDGLLVYGSIKSLTGFTFPDGTSQTTAASGGGSSTLAIANQNVNGFTSTVSSPTAVVNFSSDTFIVTLTGSATAFIQLKPISLSTVSGGSAGANAYDFGSATSLTMPQAANPTVSSTGQFAMDTSSGQVVVSTNGSTGVVVLPYLKQESLTIRVPGVGDYPFFFRSKNEATIDSVVCLSSAATSATIQLYECDANGANCTSMNTAVACTTTNTAITMTDTDITAGDRVRVMVTAVSGAPGWVGVDMYYTETRK